MPKIMPCAFGRLIKDALDYKVRKPQAWLIDEVHKDTGLYFDVWYLHKIMTGRSKNPNITASICKILDIVVPEAVGAQDELAVGNNT